jgi:RNA polymerase sigma-70 factor (ECF subfamily)
LRAPDPQHTVRRMSDHAPTDGKFSSFDEIVLPHLDAAHNFARWLVRDRDAAEDVVQEACLRAFRYFGTYRGGNARAWFLQIVRTTSLNSLHKRRGRQLETEFDEEVHSSASDLTPETMLLHRADSQLVAQALTALPDRLREVLVLRELEGLSYKEIADVVAVPIGTVMSTLSRARERFRRQLLDLLRQQERAVGPAAAGTATPQRAGIAVRGDQSSGRD